MSKISLATISNAWCSDPYDRLKHFRDGTDGFPTADYF